MKSYQFRKIPEDIFLYLKMEAARRETNISQVLVEIVAEHRNQSPPYYDIDSMISEREEPT